MKSTQIIFIILIIAMLFLIKILFNTKENIRKFITDNEKLSHCLFAIISPAILLLYHLLIHPNQSFNFYFFNYLEDLIISIIALIIVWYIDHRKE